MGKNVGEDDRLHPFVKLGGGLSGRHYEFRRARPTVDSIATVMNLAREASTVGKCCTVVTLHVNSATRIGLRQPWLNWVCLVTKLA